MGTIADKLSYLNTTKGNIKSAIIAKGVSVSENDTFRSYASKIADIEPTLGTKTITANGTYTATADNLDGYSEVTVDVEPTLGEKTITAFGVYNASDDNLDGYSKVTVGVDVEDLPGLYADFTNKTFTRIAGAVGLSAGTDFNVFPTYAGIKNCIVADDGTILAYYGDSAYTETGALLEEVTVSGTTYPIGTACQVMTYYPKFYYFVDALSVEAQSTGIGYHLRKANYYISDTIRGGFKVHPAFYDANGNEIDYVLVSTYEGCLYDASAGEYITDESQVMNTSEDKFSSIAGARPASGLTQNLTRPAVETLCSNRGTGWHSLGIKTASMIQLLMVIEMGAFNMQSAIGQGIVSITDNSSCSCASFTGSTASLGNGTGNATSTTDYSGTAQTTSGKLAVRYRGLENFWGNIWKIVQGINFWGDGTMAGGQPYICTDYEYAESKNSDNYEGAGFTLANASGYVSAFGYSTKYDWLFLPSECSGNTSLPVGDYSYVTPNLNAYRVAFLGGSWFYGALRGPFCWFADGAVGSRIRYFGGRCVYIPTASVS